MKKFSIFFLSMLLLTACSGEASEKEVVLDLDLPEEVVQPEPVELPELKPLTIPYSNEEYGFSLMLTEDWEGFVVESRELDWNDFGLSPSLDFGFTLEDDTFYSLFNIAMLELDQWTAIQFSNTVIPSYLGENEAFIFVGSGGHDNPEELNDARFAVGQILESFTLN